MASEFLRAFQKLVAAAGDDPTNLADRTDADPHLAEACQELLTALSHLNLHERYSSEWYAETVPAAEIRARREFDERWAKHVYAADPLLRGLSLPAADAAPAERTWLDRFLEEAEFYQEDFDYLLTSAKGQLESAAAAELWEEHHDTLQTALWKFEEFKLRTGIHFGAMVARLERVPFVLVPTEVAQRHGTESISLYERLRDAQRSYVFGCFLSSIALQRALLEDVLTNHYPSTGKSLWQRIEETILPWGLTKTDLHSIRELANDVLHRDKNRNIDRAELMRKTESGLVTLRRLIEAATPPAAAPGSNANSTPS